MRRFQVKPLFKDWSDPGPDLLRRRPTAIDAAVHLMDVKGPWEVRKRAGDGSFWPWQKVGSRQDVEKYLFSLLPSLDNNQVAQIGLRKPNGDVDPRIVIRCSDFRVPDLQNATTAAEETNALYQHAFPAVIFAGCFVCERLGSGWSDHSWGDAVDETEHPAEGVYNDKVFDWGVRMARAGEMQAELILGSRNGHVMQATPPDFAIINSHADKSHLWHVHTSCHSHSGQVPPCA